MAKQFHEIRDPIHVFIRFSSQERKVINSQPLQRLRHIHQLATTFLVYPGATHRRFEHSLGVMELASRVYAVVTAPENIQHTEVQSVVPTSDQHLWAYWQCVLRMAALCHDVGHLPFSHAAEEELLPNGWNHESMTALLIRSPEMKLLWNELKVDPEDIVKLALGPRKYKDGRLDEWETLLAEIITGDAFGVDRMDYLLRDSHHAGVAYGRFDHYRLVDSLRILPLERDGSTETALGIDQGGIHGAEALLLARYFMFTQLYFHHVRRIYDIHLKDFLKAWLPGGAFETDAESHLRLTDNEVLTAILAASRDPGAPGHGPARRIAERAHYKLLYSRNPDDVGVNPEATQAIYAACCDKFGAENVRCDIEPSRDRGYDFPIHTHDGRITSSISLSKPLEHVPPASFGYVFIAPELRDKAAKWLEKERQKIIEPKGEDEA